MTEHIAPEWWTVEVAQALNAIRGHEAARKRRTVLALAFAVARGESQESVWAANDPEVCSRTTWYEKWKHQPDVVRALTICAERAMAWRDEETARMEALSLQQVRRGLAEDAKRAIVGGLMGIISDANARGDHRLAAIRQFTALWNEEFAARFQDERGALPVEVQGMPEQVVKFDLSTLPIELLRAIADEDPDGGTAEGGPEGISDTESD